MADNIYNVRYFVLQKLRGYYYRVYRMKARKAETRYPDGVSMQGYLISDIRCSFACST